jgi:hypothetical protein
MYKAEVILYENKNVQSQMLCFMDLLYLLNLNTCCGIYLNIFLLQWVSMLSYLNY